MSEEILKKMETVGDAVKAVQEANENLKKKYDGIDVDVIKAASETATKAMEEIQTLRQESKAEEFTGRMDAIELALAKGGKGHEEADSQEVKQAVARYLRKGIDMPEDVIETMASKFASKSLFGATDDDVERYKKDLVAAIGPDGGFTITPDRSDQISRRIFETSPLRSIANIVTTTSDVYEMLLDDDEADCDWVGEVQSRPDTDTPQLALLKFPVHEIYAQPKATQKMLDDSGFDAEGWLAGKVSRRIGRKENNAFVVGDGAMKPKGFLAYAAWASAGIYERNAIEQITATGTAGFLDDSDDLISLQNSLLEDYQAGASFGMQRATFSSVMKLKDSQGAYLLDPNVLKTGTDKILLGKQVTFMSDMPAVANDALAVVYADWEEFYTIVDRFGIRVLRDPFTAKPYIRFYTTKRVGGGVSNFQAGKILKINS